MYIYICFDYLKDKLYPMIIRIFKVLYFFLSFAAKGQLLENDLKHLLKI